jgi:hypothetical protein
MSRLPTTSTWLVTRQRAGTVIATRAATLHTVDGCWVNGDQYSQAAVRMDPPAPSSDLSVIYGEDPGLWEDPGDYRWFDQIPH